MTLIVWFACLLGVGVILSAGRWRFAFLLVILVGVAQDVVRKAAAGQSVVFVMSCVLLISIVLMGAMARNGAISLRPITGKDQRARYLLLAFFGWVMIQGLIGLARFESIMIPAIGVLAYALPIPALWLAYVYVRDQADPLRFARLYALVGLVAAATVVLQAWGAEGWFFTSIGGEHIVFDRAAGMVISYGGIWRTPEIAAWHSGTAACMALVLLVAGRSQRSWAWLLPIVAICLYAAILTGRRKALATVVLFGALYFLGLWFMARKSRRQGFILTGLAAAALAFATLWLPGSEDRFGSHLARSGTVFGDAWDRLAGLGGSTVVDGLLVGGLFGLGAGAGAQGAQHFTSSGQVLVGGIGEGGLGKVSAELGLVGLVLALLVLIQLMRQVLHCLRTAVREDPALARIQLGFAAILAANLPVFIGAAQVYGDPYVLIILGCLLGFVLAAPRILLLRQAREAARELAALEAAALAHTAPRAAPLAFVAGRERSGAAPAALRVIDPRS